MKLQLAKGVRDINPENKIKKQQIVETLKQTFEEYGYAPLETPIIERESTLTSKYAGGEEILKEMFTLKDQGKRNLALRYDLTVPLSRYIGMSPQLKIPFKRYQIGRVFRDGPIKLGRYREFWQCDVDIIGCKKINAEAELLALTNKILNKLKIKAEIKINNRKILNQILTYSKIPSPLTNTVILSIDKLEKFGIKVVEKELLNKGIKKSAIKKLKSILSIQGTNQEKINQLKKILGPTCLTEIKELLTLLKAYDTKVTFDISLARGLSYYTGTVFEVFLKNSEIKSAIAAGGRYDNMISKLLETKKEFPAVGISFGLDVLADATPKKQIKTPTEIYIIPIQIKESAIKIAQQLREKGIKVSIDLMEKGISKNLDYANAYNIPYVLFIGEQELKNMKFKLKDMKTGKEQNLTIKNIIKKFNK